MASRRFTEAYSGMENLPFRQTGPGKEDPSCWKRLDKGEEEEDRIE